MLGEPSRFSRFRSQPETEPVGWLIPKPPCTELCPNCQEADWTVVVDHEHYRDPFLVCGECGLQFRRDLTLLDTQYAWRDGIPMPREIQTRPTYNHEDQNAR